MKKRRLFQIALVDLSLMPFMVVKAEEQIDYKNVILGAFKIEDLYKVIYVLVGAIVVILFFKYVPRLIPAKRVKVQKQKMSNTGGVILQKLGINDENFAKIAFDKFVIVEETKVSLNYDLLRKNTTGEMYDTIVKQIADLENRGQKNMVKGFECNSFKIQDAYFDKGLVHIVVLMTSSMYDYVVDKGNVVLRGNQTQKYKGQYLVTFVKITGNDYETKCPNCGADLNYINNGLCNACNTQLSMNPDDFLVSNILFVGQGK